MDRLDQPRIRQLRESYPCFDGTRTARRARAEEQCDECDDDE